jgi:hypothetical protein
MDSILNPRCYEALGLLCSQWGEALRKGNIAEADAIMAVVLRLYWRKDELTAAHLYLVESDGKEWLVAVNAELSFVIPCHKVATRQKSNPHEDARRMEDPSEEMKALLALYTTAEESDASTRFRVDGHSYHSVHLCMQALSGMAYLHVDRHLIEG